MVGWRQETGSPAHGTRPRLRRGAVRGYRETTIFSGIIDLHYGPVVILRCERVAGEKEDVGATALTHRRPGIEGAGAGGDQLDAVIGGREEIWAFDLAGARPRSLPLIDILAIRRDREHERVGGVEEDAAVVCKAEAVGGKGRIAVSVRFVGSHEAQLSSSASVETEDLRVSGAFIAASAAASK